jgi:hypothetical protein
VLDGGLVRAAAAWGGSMVMMTRGAGRRSRTISSDLGWSDGGGEATTMGWLATQKELSFIGTLGVKQGSVDWRD